LSNKNIPHPLSEADEGIGGLSNLLDVMKVVHIVVQLLLAISFESLA
jgi:hypothetical protein